MGNIYGFTNENVSSFSSLYDFDNTKVLSVLGSGDQYFASLLNGAREIDLYDINKDAWNFFILKYYGIMMLNYEEFFDFFVLKKLNDKRYFEYLLSYLPRGVGSRLDNLYKRYSGLSDYLTPDVSSINYNDGHVIPYFNMDEYYRLQSILESKDLPKFYLEDFVNLPDRLSQSRYDIVLTSNIFYWLYLDEEEEKVGEYKILLERFDCPVIQALYSWSLPNDLEKVFLENGFDISSVPSSKSFQLYDDKVVSLIKKR